MAAASYRRHLFDRTFGSQVDLRNGFPPLWMFDDIAAGQLIPVLEPYKPGDREPVHVLFPGEGAMPSRVRVFIDHLVERSARLA
jgi:DNA-binding transcriptional LysR family regulator